MHEFENNDIVPLSVNPVITDIGNYSKIKHDPVADPIKTRMPDIEPLEKGDPNIEQVLNKIQTQFFGDQSYHNKHIDAGQECVCANSNFLWQQAHELYMLDVKENVKEPEETASMNCSSVGWVCSYVLLCKNG